MTSPSRYHTILVSLEPNCSQSCPLQIDFQDTSNRSVEFRINCTEMASGFVCSITPPIGELLRPLDVTPAEFTRKKC